MIPLHELSTSPNIQHASFFWAYEISVTVGPSNWHRRGGNHTYVPRVELAVWQGRRAPLAVRSLRAPLMALEKVRASRTQ